MCEQQRFVTKHTHFCFLCVQLKRVYKAQNISRQRRCKCTRRILSQWRRIASHGRGAETRCRSNALGKHRITQRSHSRDIYFARMCRDASGAFCVAAPSARTPDERAAHVVSDCSLTPIPPLHLCVEIAGAKPASFTAKRRINA